MTLETRTLSRPLEVRAAGDSGRTIGGYAAVFNSETEIGGAWREIIAPGAFRDSLKADRDVFALFGHDRNKVLGCTGNGTLRLEEDATGLACEIDLPDTEDGKTAATLVSRGDVKGMSFGFRVTHDEWDETGDIPVRTIKALELYEVTVTAFPAYPDTSIGMRSLDEARKERRQSEIAAREGKRKAIASRLERKARQDHAFRRL